MCIPPFTTPFLFFLFSPLPLNTSVVVVGHTNSKEIGKTTDQGTGPDPNRPARGTPPPFFPSSPFLTPLPCRGGHPGKSLFSGDDDESRSHLRWSSPAVLFPTLPPPLSLLFSFFFFLFDILPELRIDLTPTFFVPRKRHERMLHPTGNWRCLISQFLFPFFLFPLFFFFLFLCLSSWRFLYFPSSG